MLDNISRRLNGAPPNTLHSSADIDITPMLDVVFIMLIFFIVTASFVKESGFGINTPASDAISVTPPSVPPIILEINAKNEITIQSIAVAQTSIRATVVRLKTEFPDSPVVVMLHPLARTATMVAAMDQLRSAQVLMPSVSLIPT